MHSLLNKSNMSAEQPLQSNPASCAADLPFFSEDKLAA
jgi:hypothetical protein